MIKYFNVLKNMTKLNKIVIFDIQGYGKNLNFSKETLRLSIKS